MQLRVDVYHHNGDSERLDRIEGYLVAILAAIAENSKLEAEIMANLQDVTNDVAAERSLIDGLSTLTSGLKAQLDAITAGNLPPAVQAQVDALFASVESNKQALADALAANTPADTSTGS